MIVSLFQVTWEAWVMIIGVTIIIILGHYMLFRLYQLLSPGMNKIVLIFGLGSMSLIGNLAWLFTFLLLTRLWPK
jgi:hypothetical protein